MNTTFEVHTGWGTPQSGRDAWLAPDPWLTREEDFPSHAILPEQLRFALNYAVLAPSSRNSQPWRFRILDDSIELHADPSRALSEADPGLRELTISCGAALFHLRTALRHFGFAFRVDRSPAASEGDLLAAIHVTDRQPECSPVRALFYAITSRRTCRLPFTPGSLPGELLEEMRQLAMEHSAWFRAVESGLQRREVASLVAEGDRVQMADPLFRRELSDWIHPNRSRRRDGIPASELGIGDLGSRIAGFVFRNLDVGPAQAAQDQEMALRSPVLAVIGTDGDSRADWLAAGEALSHLLLRAAHDDVAVSYLNQPIQVTALRPRLAEALGGGGYPQILLRMGQCGAYLEPTPRRPVSEVLLP